MICFDQHACHDPERTRTLEWLETNGLGGFASSTITGLNTRRYHGLLTAATKPPVGRLVLLSKLEETLLVDGQHFDLSANQYPGAIYPHGYRYLKEFRLDPFPTFVYEVAGMEIEKRVFMVHGENTTVIEYDIHPVTGSEIAPPTQCVLELRPLIAFRDYHSLTHHNDGLDKTVHQQPGLTSITPYAGLPTLNFAHNAETCAESGNWYFNFQYVAERERGLEDNEDLFNPFVLRYPIRFSEGGAKADTGDTATLIAGTHAVTVANLRALRDGEKRRRAAVIGHAPSVEPFIRTLVSAADQFIVQRGEWDTVIAGYHWFADWGRDTMISLPGLTLMTGRPEAARAILQEFADRADQGMLPNRFPDDGEAPEYNTADAALWMFEAVRSYLHYTGDEDFVRDRLYPKLKEIINWHLQGTRFGIHVGADGLLCAGEAGVQLTWMDAKVGEWVVTPRAGKPVEIQALWYNALCVMRQLAEMFEDAALAASLRESAAKTQQSFNEQFWNEEAGCLFDVVNGAHRDAAIRPNQVFAVSLHHRMLPPGKEASLMKVVEQELLTPLGLRTLSPKDPNYKPHYEGGVKERDSAYHQGTVWLWLMGPFISAYSKAHGRSNQARARVKLWLESFNEHLTAAGLGQLSEIADGDAPHTPRGCIAQAWSVAELLRATVEDVCETPISYRPTTAAVTEPR